MKRRTHLNPIPTTPKLPIRRTILTSAYKLLGISTKGNFQVVIIHITHFLHLVIHEAHVCYAITGTINRCLPSSFRSSHIALRSCTNLKEYWYCFKYYDICIYIYDRISYACLAPHARHKT